MNDFLKSELDLQYFHDNGYIRKQCQSCGCYYWTLDINSRYCGDQPCVPFSFINNPLGKKKLTLSSVRESFLSYFENHNHQRLHYPITDERMPVVARWRNDIYLTIASIADFQPHVTSGIVPPPANPLVISQPCIRLNDLDEVGKSGRHLTLFEMMGHHAFNANIDEIYWKEKTVGYANDYFVNTIGIPKEAINYKEELWVGGGNAGPCLEVVAAGLEIATLVFMNMKQDSKGSFTIENEKYTNNPLNIVDTGYGLERIAWITNGTKTVYETVLQETLQWIQQHANDISDQQAFYSLADHSKSLAFMLGDGIVPSNVKDGYLARLLIRRSLRFIKSLQFNKTLSDLVAFQIDLLHHDFPSLINQKKQIVEMLTLETNRYKETLAKGEQLVKRLLKEKQTIDDNTLVTLYDTHGMPPSVVKQIAEKEQVSVILPDNFESMIAELHTHEKEIVDSQTIHETLPDTKALYYTDHYMKEFDAEVRWIKKTDEGTQVVLNQTVFYPEGGGQLGDTGVLISKGNELPVISVTKENNSIIHHVNGDLEVGEHIHGRIDWDHRYTLMKHHTGTHLINGALREILGEHIWQAGSQLGIADARFDYSHYQALTDEDIIKIEARANQFIQEKVPVKKLVLDRNNAEKKYGFRLFQGGVPPGNQIRVLDIPSVDVEACGGTHVNNTEEIEKIRIIKSERIQDGVNRIIFAAGKMVDAYKQKEESYYHQIIESFKPMIKITNIENSTDAIKIITKIFSVPIEQVPKTIKRFIKEASINEKKTVSSVEEASDFLFNSWKEHQKKKKNIDIDNLEILRSTAEIIPGTSIKVLIAKTNTEANATAGALIAESDYVVHIYDGKKVTSAASENVSIDFREQIVPAIGSILGGSGGGRPKMAQSGGPNHNRIDEALKKAKQLTIEILKK